MSRTWIALTLLSLTSHVVLAGEKPKKMGDTHQWLKTRVERITGLSDERGNYSAEKKLLEDTRAELKDETFHKCTQPFMDYLTAAEYIETKKETHKLGHTIEDKEYFSRSAPYIGIESLPSELKAESFLKSMQKTRMETPSSFADLQAELKKANEGLAPESQWKFISFIPYSSLAPTIDGSGIHIDDDLPPIAGRGMIYIPASYFRSSKQTPKPAIRDLYLQFSIKYNSSSSNPAQQLSVLAVTQNEKSSEKSGHKKEFFIADHWRSADHKVTHPPSTVPQANGQECYTCHSSGPLAIHTHPLTIAAYYPVTGPHPSSEEAQAALKAMNRTIEQNGSTPKFAPNIDQFPSIGEDEKSPFSDSASIRACLDEPEPEEQDEIEERQTLKSIKAVKAAMNCRSCHDHGKMRSPLHFSPFMNMTLLSEYIRKGYMPPGHKLSEHQQAALISCLVQGYTFRMTQYLTKTSCSVAPPFNDLLHSTEHSLRGVSEAKEKTVPPLNSDAVKKPPPGDSSTAESGN